MSEQAAPRPAPGTPEFWNQRYGAASDLYGTEPNDFLAETAPRLKKGRAFLPADGEGRNGVWLAQRGFAVVTLDLAAVAVARARERAERAGVPLDARVGDLLTNPPAESAFDLVAVLHLHLPSPLRRRVYRSCARALAPGGVFLFEGFSPRHLSLPEAGRSGSPPSDELMAAPDELRDLLPSFIPVICEEKDVTLREGAYHNGRAIVTRALLHRP